MTDAASRTAAGPDNYEPSGPEVTPAAGTEEAKKLGCPCAPADTYPGGIHYMGCPLFKQGEAVALINDQAATRLRLAIVDAVTFLDARRRDGIDFPYDSRPLRKLREIAAEWPSFYKEGE